jgi:hypothetical protein
MKLFGKKKKHSHSRRSVPLEEQQRRRADKLYMARIKDDPKLMDLYIERFLGIKIPDPDPVKEERTKLQVAIIDKAIERISKNPELANHLSAAKIEEIAGIKVDRVIEEGYDSEGYFPVCLTKWHLCDSLRTDRVTSGNRLNSVDWYISLNLTLKLILGYFDQ